MRKFFGIKIGGLQQKILNLVLIFLLMTIAVATALSLVKTRQLSKIVSSARDEQQQAIETVSENTVHSVLEGSMIKTNALQTYIADDMFSDIESGTLALSTYAADLFAAGRGTAPADFELPDAANEGVLTVQVLSEEGVDPYKSEYIGIAANMSDMMKALCLNSKYMDNCYFGLADGTHICVDEHSANKFDENGELIPFPVRERPWYKRAAENGKLCFSGVMKDAYTGSICVTCSAPVYVDGELIGVVGVDIFLDSMEKYVEDSTSEGAFICIVSNEGQPVFAPADNGIFSINEDSSAEDLRLSENKKLAEFITLALSEQTGLHIVNVNGKDYYMAGSPMQTVGWSAISVVEKSVTEQSANEMSADIDRINADAKQKYNDGTMALRQQTLIMVAIILILGTGTALFVAGRIVNPIESMTADIMEGARTGKLFEMKPIYKTKDEIEVLAEAFDDLSRKTKQYIIDITNITKEKERIVTELELAHRIQADMLPNIYPAFPDRPEFDIYATMTPAKEVGGDFYDFFLIDNDHLGMVMADVSGKGVPAALFMMMSKILINNYAAQNASPAEVLKRTNEVICRNNKEEMFITVWFGVLEISTGKITAANAGHEYPIIRRSDGCYELFKDKHGFVIGGMEGIKYKEYEIQLEKGGGLFLYTDGVPEATDKDLELYGTDRLIEALNSNKTDDQKALIASVKDSVDSFVGEADQFDDMTMLGLIIR